MGDVPRTPVASHSKDFLKQLRLSGSCTCGRVANSVLTWVEEGGRHLVNLIFHFLVSSLETIKSPPLEISFLSISSDKLYLSS